MDSQQLPTPSFLEFEADLPKILHVELSQHDIGLKRVFVIGDVHGCCVEQKRLLELAEALDSQHTMVIYAGDLVNKGEENINALELAMKSNALAIRGNHEHAVLKQYWMWKRFDRTPDEWAEWVMQLKIEHVEWMQELPLSISIPHLNTLIVHAGIVPGRTLVEQNPRDLLAMRDLVVDEQCILDGKMDSAVALSKGNSDSKPWAQIYSRYEELHHQNSPTLVIFGHDAKRKLQLYPYAIGLDTGCVYGGHLSGVFVHDAMHNHDILQVQAAKEYAPKTDS